MPWKGSKPKIGNCLLTLKIINKVLQVHFMNNGFTVYSCTLLSQIIIIGLPWLKEELSNLLNSFKKIFFTKLCLGDPMIFSGVLLCTVRHWIKVIWLWIMSSPQGAAQPPPLSTEKAGRNHLKSKISPSYPTEIGERFSQNHIKFMASSADVNSPYKRKCWTNSVVPLVNSLLYSLLWGQAPKANFPLGDEISPLNSSPSLAFESKNWSIWC